MRFVLLAVLVCSCSVIYDTDDLEICSELPRFPDPLCPASILSCFEACGGDERCSVACYDQNRDGEFDETELACYQCTLFTFYQCLADEGCAEQIESVFCCDEALCPGAGCPDDENPCQPEGDALNECVLALPDPMICNAAGFACFNLP